MRPLLRLLAPLLALSFSVFAMGCAADAQTPTDEGTADSELTSVNEKTAFEFFVAKGLTEIQAAAIVGNLQQESSVNPGSVQPGGPGRGIAQWSNGARWNHTSGDNVAWYANREGESALSLNLQLAFIWYELETFSQYGLSALRHSSSINTATLVFMRDFEACGACNATRRESYARAVLAAYGSH
jgi:hypothetical protein